MLNLMMLTGKGSKAMLFVGQPAIKDMVDRMKARSRDLENTAQLSTYRREQNAIREVFKEYNEAMKEAFEEFLRHYSNDGKSIKSELMGEFMDTESQRWPMMAITLNKMFMNRNRVVDPETGIVPEITEGMVTQVMGAVGSLLNSKIEGVNSTELDLKQRDDFGKQATEFLKRGSDFRKFTGKVATKEEAKANLIWLAKQNFMLQLWQEFTPAAQSLNKLMSISRIDAKKQGKNLREAIEYRRKINTFLTRNAIINNAQEYFNNTYLRAELENGVDTILKIYGQAQLEYSPKFLREYEHLKYVTGNENNSDPINDKQLHNTLRGAVLHQYFDRAAKADPAVAKWLSYSNTGLQQVTNWQKHMHFGTNAIPVLLIELKKQANINPKLKKWASNRAGINDRLGAINILDFLLTILPNEGDVFANTPSYIAIANVNEVDAETRVAITHSWEDMLSDNNEFELPNGNTMKVKEFANLLAYYAYLTSGFNHGSATFHNYIPVNWFHSKGINGEVRDALSDSMDASETDLEGYYGLTDTVLRNMMHSRLITLYPFQFNADVNPSTMRGPLTAEAANAKFTVVGQSAQLRYKIWTELTAEDKGVLGVNTLEEYEKLCKMLQDSSGKPLPALVAYDTLMYRKYGATFVVDPSKELLVSTPFVGESIDTEEETTNPQFQKYIKVPTPSKDPKSPKFALYKYIGYRLKPVGDSAPGAFETHDVYNVLTGRKEKAYKFVPIYMLTSSLGTRNVDEASNIVTQIYEYGNQDNESFIPANKRGLTSFTDTELATLKALMRPEDYAEFFEEDGSYKFTMYTGDDRSPFEHRDDRLGERKGPPSAQFARNISPAYGYYNKFSTTGYDTFNFRSQSDKRTGFLKWYERNYNKEDVKAQ
jgi:hypothetical protein